MKHNNRHASEVDRKTKTKHSE